MTALAGHVGHRYPPPARHASVPQRQDATTRRLVRLLALGVGAVLVVQGCAVAAARDGRFGFGLLLYYTTVLLPFVATVVLLVRGDLPARLRAGVVVVLGVVSTVLHRLTDPLLLTGFDEQLHLRTLNDLLAGAPLFAPNPLLSASPDYPGLELLTVFLQRATGLPTMVAVTAVVLACRVVLVLGIYQLATLLTGDARTGSVAVAFYAASPQFYFFNSQYAYQTLAVSLALGGLGVVARACVAGSGRRALGALAVLCFAGVTVTHHLTGWATLVGLLVWAVLAPDRNRRLVWGVAGATAAVVAAWTVPMAAELVRYLGPVFAAAWDQVSSLLHGGAHRSMFHDSAGSATPLWERAVLLGYAGAYTVLAAVTGVVLLRRARRYGDRVSLVLALVCLAYPAIFATRVTPMAADVGDRSTTFVFVPLALGVALLLRSWWYRRGAGTAVRPVVTLGIVALSTLGYFGGLVLGSGPDWGRLPGGYLVAADSRSLDPETLAAVEWSAAHLAPGQSIMADRMPATLLASRARLWLVASPTAGVEPAGLYFATTWGPEQVRTARAARLRYLYVDTRLAGSGPHEGWYFYPGETPDQRRLTAPALAKFATARGLTAVYRHGPVSIYDLRALAGTPSPRGWTGAWHQRPWLDAGAGLLAGLLLAWRWVGLRRRFGPLLHAAGGAGATAGAMAAVLLVTGVATAVSFRPGWQFSVALVVPVVCWRALRRRSWRVAWRWRPAWRCSPRRDSASRCARRTSRTGSRWRGFSPRSRGDDRALARGRSWQWQTGPSLARMRGGGLMTLANVRPRSGYRIAEIAGSILGTQLVTGVLGVVYWTAAARGLRPAVVGELGAATAATVLLGTFGTLGFGTLLVSRLGAAPAARRRALLLTGLGAGGAAGTALGVLFGLGAAAFIPAFGFLAPRHAAFWWLVASAGATAVGLVFDQAMLVVGRPTAQVLRNGVASVLKVALLVVAVAAGRAGVAWGLGAWAVGQLVANALALRSALRAVPGGTGTGLAEVRAVLGAHWREAAGHHGMNIALSAPSMLQPVIIGATVSAVSNAAFTTVRLVSMLAFMAPYALAMALFAAAAADPGSLRARSRTVFRVSLGLSLVLYAVLFVSAPLVLRVFGAGYVTSATHYLRIIGIACPLLVFKDQYIAQTRADHRSATAMPYVVASTVLEIAGTYAGSLVAGLAGALVGWLTALALGVGYVCLRWHRDRGVVDTGA